MEQRLLSLLYQIHKVVNRILKCFVETLTSCTAQQFQQTDSGAWRIIFGQDRKTATRTGSSAWIFTIIHNGYICMTCHMSQHISCTGRFPLSSLNFSNSSPLAKSFTVYLATFWMYVFSLSSTAVWHSNTPWSSTPVVHSYLPYIMDSFFTSSRPHMKAPWYTND